MYDNYPRSTLLIFNDRNFAVVSSHRRTCNKTASQKSNSNTFAAPGRCRRLAKNHRQQMGSRFYSTKHNESVSFFVNLH